MDSHSLPPKSTPHLLSLSLSLSLTSSAAQSHLLHHQKIFKISRVGGAKGKKNKITVTSDSNFSKSSRISSYVPRSKLIQMPSNTADQSVKMEYQEAFERDFCQLKPYYTDASLLQRELQPAVAVLNTTIWTRALARLLLLLEQVN